MMKLRGAIDAGREYELPERHDPFYLMFDNDFLLGESFARVREPTNLARGIESQDQHLSPQLRERFSPVVLLSKSNHSFP